MLLEFALIRGTHAKSNTDIDMWAKSALLTSALVTALLKMLHVTSSFGHAFLSNAASIFLPVSHAQHCQACLPAGKHLADAQHTDALPQATQALPLSTQAQMHASGSAEPGTQLDSRLKKLPIHGPRLPDRTRPRNRSPKESASYPTQPAARAETSAVSQSPAPDQAKMPAAPAPQTMTPQPPMAKRIKSEEGAQSQQPMTPVCFAVQSAPVQPLQGCEPAQTKTPAFRPPQSQTPLLPQNTLGAAACSQAQLALQGSAVTVGQPQKLLDLFGAGASLNLQQKQDALEALIASVADGM